MSAQRPGDLGGTRRRDVSEPQICDKNRNVLHQKPAGLLFLFPPQSRHYLSSDKLGFNPTSARSLSCSS